MARIDQDQTFPDTHAERLEEVARDQAIHNAYMSRAALSGTFDGVEVNPLPPRPHSARRRGRSFPQDESRADVPDLPNPTPRTAEEEAALSGIGHKQVVADGITATARANRKAAGSDIRTQLALQKSRSERRDADLEKWRKQRGINV